MKVLGLDPGLGVTGYAVLEAVGETTRLLEAGALRGDSSEPLEVRLSRLYRHISDIIEEFKVDAVALEDLYSHYKHPTTAIKMGHARGVMVLAAGILGSKVYTYGATRVKKAITGHGHASKRQMQGMVQHRLGLPEPPRPADVADAIAVGLCHIANIRHRRKSPLF